jgi:putative ABC transport system substrate-binding protein
MKRRDTLLGLLALGAAPLAARAQPAAKPARIVILVWGPTPASPPAVSPYLDAFKRGLQALGHIEGKTFVIERRWTLAKAENLPDLANELAALKPDVVLASGEPSARAAQQAAPAVPVVLGYSGDPVAGGFAKSLARPGGKVTGVATLNEDTSPKLLELALTVVPLPRRMAVLANPTVPSYASVRKNLEDAARQARVDLLSIEVRNAAEIDSGFARIAREKLRAVVVLGDPLVFQQRQQIGDLALKYGVASVYPAKEHVLAGGLISYGVNIVDGFRRAAAHVDKILKGAKPGDLPIEQATTLELVINLKTAKALGLTIPQSLLLRADRVIE